MLLNSDYGQLISDDDSGDGMNFSMSFYCEAGETYYPGARMLWVGEEGDVTLVVERQA